MIEHLVSKDSPIRLDAYCLDILASCSSRSQSKKWIKAGFITVNQKQQSPAYFPKKGDIIQFHPPRSQKAQQTIALSILYEDNHSAVVYKPAGIHVSGNRPKTLRLSLPGALVPSTHETRLPQPEPVHRLDRRTSGLVLVAKTSLAAKHFGLQFEKRTIQKVYRAIVLGACKDGTSDMMLDGKESYSSWKSLRQIRALKCSFLTELEIYPKTGRTHQIRRHLHHAGHPILGDDLYHNGLIRKDKGLFLCATELCFTTLDSQKIHISTPPPDKFNSYLQREERRYTRYHP